MNILFICTGNTCRSCMAEAIFNKLCDIKDINAFSAGISVVSGSISSEYSSKLLIDNLDVDISTRKAVQLNSELIKKSDLILAMSNNAKDYAMRFFEVPQEKIFTLNQYVGVIGEVADPYGGDMVIYEKTYKQLTELIKLLIVKLKEDNSI